MTEEGLHAALWRPTCAVIMPLECNYDTVLLVHMAILSFLMEDAC